MDFLNKAFAQLNDLFRSMSPGGRITAGLLLVVAVVSVGYLFQSQASGGDDDLFGGEPIAVPTLQKMRAAFGKAGLNEFAFEGDRVKVPRAKRAAYLAALVEAKALPTHFGDQMKEAADGSLMQSPKQHDERWKLGLELEMSAVISRMKGIQDASVMVNSQPSPGLGQPRTNTAAVSAEAIGGVALDEEQVDKIRYYVAAASGMKPDDVTIADANGVVHPAGESGQAGPNGDPYARAVRKAEQDLEIKIRKSLAYIPNLTVTPSVVLSPEKGTRIQENKIDPKTIPVRSEEDTRSTTRDASSPGGAPGVGSQGGGVNQPASLASAGRSGNETSEESKSKQVNTNSSTITETEKYGLTPKSAKVSVGIPASYYEKVWKEHNPTAENDEAKKKAAIDKIKEEVTQDVRAHVATLLPPSPDGKDQTAAVTVTTFQDIKAAEVAGPAIPQRALTWLGENWPMLAMVGLVLVSVGMLRSALKGVPAAATTEPSPIAARISASEPTKGEESQEPVEVAAARRLRRMTGSGPSLRDELSDLVKEDPDSAASILRSWIGQMN